MLFQGNILDFNFFKKLDNKDVSRREEKDERTKDSISKDVQNLFRLKKEIEEIDYIAIKDVRNHFTLKKEKDAIKNRIIRDIRRLFEHEEYYYRSVRVSNFWSNNYMEYESTVTKIKHHFKNILIKSNHN